MTYQSRTTAHAHQTEAMTRLRAQPSTFALLMGMGTGKTKVILDEWGERVSEVPNLLVVAPAGSFGNR